ncbi:MAG: aminotransferase class I/II-fold pyridoxal phosphate-dependent enzyme [Acidimicrobiia bacterium]|nr:aminotransferase class I/II-fold pyridoxal phosphate-dependent enzyme [Acidimicrobiia bacterium]
MKPSARSDIPPFYVMEVMKAAADRERTHGDVLHLEVGQPSTPAPQTVLARAAAVLADDRLGYTHALGVDELRGRIARLYLERHGLEIPRRRVAITAGASGGFVLALLAAFDAGARIGITEPGYAAYRNIISALGLELVGIRVGKENRYVPTPDDLARVGPLDGLVTASPSNPTGTMFTDEEQAAIVDACRSRGVRLIADEIYHGITYGRAAPTVLEHTDDAVVVQSFSKYQSMTGWRLGWLILPDELVRPFERLAQNLFICPSAIAQHAAIAAFDGTADLDANVARYAASRVALIEGLGRMGLGDMAPVEGAFYVWVDVSSLEIDSQELCARWLAEIGVAATPGVDFDPVAGDRFVRFSYSEATVHIVEAVERLEGWMAARADRLAGRDG